MPIYHGSKCSVLITFLLLINYCSCEVKFCPFYVTSDTSSATSNVDSCAITACPNDVLLATGLDVNQGNCLGDQFLRLYSDSNVEVAQNDDYCGPEYCGGSCSQISYTIPPTQPCQTYYLLEGCFGESACSGTVAVSVSPKPLESTNSQSLVKVNTISTRERDSTKDSVVTLATYVAPTQRPSIRPTTLPTVSTTAPNGLFNSTSQNEGSIQGNYCPQYQVSSTNSANSNVAICSFTACPNQVILASGLSSEGGVCSGDQYFRLYSASNTEVAANDDYNGACSRILYTVPSTEQCQTYQLWEGCYRNNNCGGSTFVSITSAPSAVPTQFPTLAPSGPTRTPSGPTSAPTSSDPIKCLTKYGYNICVGLSNDVPYCYGYAWGCRWGYGDCRTDSDCQQKYTSSSSTRYTNSQQWQCGQYLESYGSLNSDWPVQSCLLNYTSSVTGATVPAPTSAPTATINSDFYASVSYVDDQCQQPYQYSLYRLGVCISNGGWSSYMYSHPAYDAYGRPTVLYSYYGDGNCGYQYGSYRQTGSTCGYGYNNVFVPSLDSLPPGVLSASYSQEANCTAQGKFETANYYPLNACNYGSKYTSCTVDGYKKVRFSDPYCRGSPIVQYLGSNYTANNSSNSSSSSTVPNSYPTTYPQSGAPTPAKTALNESTPLQTCAQSWSGYTRQICSAFRPTTSPTLQPTGPSVKPVVAPSQRPSAGPTQFPSSSDAINTGYVAEGWSQTYDCSGSYPQLTFYRLGACVNQGLSSVKYSDYVPGSGGSVLINSYRDGRCRDLSNSYRRSIACNGYGSKIIYVPSLQHDSLPPGVMTSNFRSLDSCYVTDEPDSASYYQLGQCINQWQLYTTCTDSNYETQNFYWGQSCTGTPYSVYNRSITTSGTGCGYSPSSPVYYQRTYCSALKYTAPPTPAPTRLPSRAPSAPGGPRRPRTGAPATDPTRPSSRLGAKAAAGREAAAGGQAAAGAAAAISSQHRPPRHSSHHSARQKSHQAAAQDLGVQRIVAAKGVVVPLASGLSLTDRAAETHSLGHESAIRDETANAAAASVTSEVETESTEETALAPEATEATEEADAASSIDLAAASAAASLSLGSADNALESASRAVGDAAESVLSGAARRIGVSVQVLLGLQGAVLVLVVGGVGVFFYSHSKSGQQQQQQQAGAVALSTV